MGWIHGGRASAGPYVCKHKNGADCPICAEEEKARREAIDQQYRSEAAQAMDVWAEEVARKWLPVPDTATIMEYSYETDNFVPVAAVDYSPKGAVYHPVTLKVQYVPYVDGLYDIIKL